MLGIRVFERSCLCLHASVCEMINCGIGFNPPQSVDLYKIRKIFHAEFTNESLLGSDDDDFIISDCFYFCCCST